METITSELLDQYIGRLSSLTFRILSFPAALEARYEETSGPARCKRIWLEGLFAIAIFDLVQVLRHAALHVADSRPVFRFGLGATLIALLINSGMLLKPRAVYRESLIAIFVSGLALGEFTLRTHSTLLDVGFMQLGVATIAIFANTVIRLRPLYAMASSVVILGGEVFYLSRNPNLVHGEKVLAFSLLASAVLLSLISNYSQNREDRLGFLLCLRGNLLVDKLEVANDELAVVAERDALTRLPNRYAFDRRLKKVWADAQEDGSVVSIVVVDVDHFKKLNDRFGHLYGDQVLRRFGHLIEQSLRKKEDFAARFGGEEFILLLPGTSTASALLVAERLRALIELAGLPAIDQLVEIGANVSATVSCGVASASPFQIDDPLRLIELADKALYQAKDRGRNLVCAASELWEAGALVGGAPALGLFAATGQ